MCPPQRAAEEFFGPSPMSLLFDEKEGSFLADLFCGWASPPGRAPQAVMQELAGPADGGQ